MKKLLLLTLAIATLTSMGYSQTTPAKKNGWEEANLKGKVKSLTESKYGAEDRFGEIQKKESSLSSKETYKYDDKGNLIEKNNYNAGGRLDYKTTNKYDDKGNQIEVNGHDSDGSLIYMKTYKYDDKGNQIEVNGHDSDGSLSIKSTYKYDDKGNQIEQYGKMIVKPYKYDAIGNLIESNNYNADGSLNSKTTYKYDAKSNLIEANYYGSLDGKYTYKYDAKGNCIEATDPQYGELMQCTYKYDEKGNWIKRIEFINTKAENIYERKYEYYDTLTSLVYSQTTPPIQRGGIIVYEKDGHGLVAAPTDLGAMNLESAKTACDNLVLNGYSDWHLPSKEELNALYVNLKQLGVGGFASTNYWSSTEDNDYSAWKQYFGNGRQSNDYKNGNYDVRAVRAF